LARRFEDTTNEPGFGLPVLEAFASGIPVVASTTTSLPEVAGDAARLVDPTDVDAIAAAMSAILDRSRLAGRLRTAGLARARTYTCAPCFRNGAGAPFSPLETGISRFRPGPDRRARGGTVDGGPFRCIIALLCCTFSRSAPPAGHQGGVRKTNFGKWTAAAL
jgi:hypothetical protein